MVMTWEEEPGGQTVAEEGAGHHHPAPASLGVVMLSHGTVHHITPAQGWDVLKHSDISDTTIVV